MNFKSIKEGNITRHYTRETNKLHSISIKIGGKIAVYTIDRNEVYFYVPSKEGNLKEYKLEIKKDIFNSNMEYFAIYNIKYYLKNLITV